MKFARYLFFIAAFLSAPSYATPIQDLYSARIEVPAEADHDYHLYLRSAFEQVVVKLTGNSQALKQFSAFRDEDFASALKSYSYLGNTLVINLEPESINRWLSAAKLPIWGVERPLLLVWVSMQDAQPARLIGADGLEPIISLLTTSAQQYALPIELPLLDLKELEKISLQTLAEKNWAVLAQVGQTYRAAGHLILSLRQDPETQAWTSSWAIKVGAQEFQWEETASNLTEAINHGLEKSHHELAQVYARSDSTTPEVVQVVIDNIRDYTAYEKALAYLKKLPPVQHIQILEVAADRVVYQLQLNGGTDALQQAVAADRLLERLEGSADLPLALEYRLIS